MSTLQPDANRELEDYESFSPIMTREEANDWFTKRLGRPPEAVDIFKIGKSFYSLGAYSRALVCFQHYITFSNALTTGHHVLGYCYLHLGELESAFHEFKYCATTDMQEDWQMVVELAIEIESTKKSTSLTSTLFPTKTTTVATEDKCPDDLATSISKD